jgi:hypothetical protein
MTHQTFRRGGGGSGSAEGGTIEDLRGTVVQDKYIDAAIEASKAFRKNNIRHALVGGLAVGVRGYIRNTGDVDFLVSEDAFEHHGMMVTPKPGLPIRWDDVQIDWVSLSEPEQSLFEQFLEMPAEGSVPVVPAHVLVVMKAIAGRQKDLADMVELMKAGADVHAALDLAVPLRSNVRRLIEKMHDKALEEAE